MYKKKDFNFLEKYEKISFKTGIILCTGEWIHIIINSFQESHKIQTECSQDVYFDLRDFLGKYKKIHGSRHVFTIGNDGLHIQTKKTGEEEIIGVEKGIKVSPLVPKEKGCHLNNCNFKQFDILSSINMDLSYISFLKDASLVIEEDNSYIWKTNGITDIYIQLPSLSKPMGYIPHSLMTLFANWQGEEAYISIEKNVPGIGVDNLVLHDDENILAVAMNRNEEYNTYELPSSSQQYTLTSEELKNLQSIKFKKLLAQIKKEKNLKTSYEVYVEIVDGIWYMNEEKFFETEGKITTRRYEGYKLATFINNAKHLTVHDTYLQDGNIYFI